MADMTPNLVIYESASFPGSAMQPHDDEHGSAFKTSSLSLCRNVAWRVSLSFVWSSPYLEGPFKSRLRLALEYLHAQRNRRLFNGTNNP
eukprot:scaffold40385_cov26-Prasinocladus_malaysianus.AAC.1